nr:LysR family transcriptional regulator [Flexivirga meconopsidis]
MRQLVYFEAVVRCNGFTRAAEDLHVAQPAISAQVRRLERELGVRLLQRSTRSVTPTPVGLDFLAEVRLTLEHVHAARAVTESHREVERGQLRVGATAITGPLDVTTELGAFRRRYPGVAISLRSDLIAPLLDQLRDESLDVVVGPVHEQRVPGLAVRRIATEELVLITPPGDRRRVRGLLDVAREDFVCLPQGSGLRTLLTEAFAGLPAPRVVFEAASPGGIRDAVSAGLGVALVARSATQHDGRPVRVHRVPGMPAHPPIGVFWRARSVSAAARRFVEQVMQGG